MEGQQEEGGEDREGLVRHVGAVRRHVRDGPAHRGNSIQQIYDFLRSFRLILRLKYDQGK